MYDILCFCVNEDSLFTDELSSGTLVKDSTKEEPP